MIVGDKAKFAVEWALICILEGKKYFRFCFWSQDLIIGDFEDDVMDSIVSGYIKDFLRTQEVRGKYNFSTLDIFAIYNIIFGHFIGECDDTYIEKAEILENDLDSQDVDVQSVFHLHDIGGTGFDRFADLSCKISDT